MNTRTALKRLLETIAFAVLAGGLAYGVTAWLALNSESALLAATVVAAIAGLLALTPSTIIQAFAPSKKQSSSASDDLYHSLEFRLTNHTGNETFEYRPEDDDPDRL